VTIKHERIKIYQRNSLSWRGMGKKEVGKDREREREGEQKQ